ncbi:hypothetical protein ASD62_11730 [Phycicoccus sp. Root563]|uniref:glycosyltransferase family A protein n=1 Tax=Phycicoccus sp. Root563 TaxID=1736562 RepID=UPI0007026603|nr:glycosyltransferase family A protein [Phycicoccus sp. Root563]KQZ89869.1 hypothetical protein ASD62_11730 [Phycicoccus sp. Root563]
MTTTSVVVDLTGDDSQDALSVARDALAGRLVAAPVSWVFIVQDNGLLAAELARAECALVTVVVGNSPPVNAWSAGVQVVVDGEVLFIPSPEACLALQLEDLGLLGDADVAIAYASHDPGHPAAVRLLAFTAAAYASVRGFHLGIRDPKQCLVDLVTRIVWANGRPAVQSDPPDEPDSNYAPPRGVVTNLPAWRFRPPSSAPLVTAVVMVTDGFEPDCLSAIKAQVLDDLSVVVLDTTQSSQVREWVESNQRDYPRFGLRDSITYLAIGNTSHDNEAALSLCAAEYLLFMNARDLLLPWAMETALRRFKAGTSAVAGPRVHFDRSSGNVSSTAEPYLDSVAMVKRSTALTLLSHAHPTARTFGSWEFMRPLLGGADHTTIAFALSATADPQPTKGVRWLSTTPKVDPVRLAAPYLPDTTVERFLVFSRYCVGKIDEIDGYSRLVGVVSSFSPSGTATDEIAVVEKATYRDMARLSRSNIPYEIVALTPSTQPRSHCREAVQRILTKMLHSLPATDVLRIESVDAVGGIETPSSDLLGWLSFRPGRQKPLNLALSAERAEAVRSRTFGDSSVTYWSRTTMQEQDDE